MVGDVVPRVTDELARLSGRFTSRTRDTGLAARLGIALGVAFGLCFLTGLVSHFMQHPLPWLPWPARPVWFYRVTQGVHVVTGTALVPLLLAKFWAVYPRLFTWPPFRSLAHAAERGFVLLLVVAALFQVSTGLANIASWYPFGFFFTTAHYAVAWLLAGALVVHVAHKWRTTRDALRVPLRDPADASLSRRQFLTAAGVTSGLLVAVTAGQTVPALRPLGLLATRRSDVGPQGLPVNRSAVAAGVTELVHAPDYRLRVTGAVDRELTLALAGLRALPQVSARLPITCVEGWSADATWTGIRLRELLDRAGAAPGARVRVASLQRKGGYRESYVDPPHARDPLTLLALRVNGEPLAADHGFPCRLIAPNRPGVLQTKWVTEVEVLP
ncbi:MAG: molybdopterin-dependent oxidoreductase [Streptosporangiales bacterium]|nr:molybdopterin-dependent oxidoreductase [Streptosporangiales bacterium]